MTGSTFQVMDVAFESSILMKREGVWGREGCPARPERTLADFTILLLAAVGSTCSVL